MVELLFLVVPWGCLRFVIVVFPDHTHLLFSITLYYTQISEILGNVKRIYSLEDIYFFRQMPNVFIECSKKSVFLLIIPILYFTTKSKIYLVHVNSKKVNLLFYTQRRATESKFYFCLGRFVTFYIFGMFIGNTI